MVNQDGQRLSYVDAARGIGILLIALGHISYITNPVVTYGNSFKLTIFYLISGYLFSLKKDVRSGPYIFSRLKMLGIPYVFFSIIEIAYSSLKDYVRGDFVSSDLMNSIYRVVTLRGVSTLWFLPSLFLIELVFIYLIKRCNKAARIVVLTALPLICCGLVYIFDLTDINISEYYIPLVLVKVLLGVWFYSIGYYCLEVLVNLPFALLVVIAGVNVYFAMLNTGIDVNGFKLGKYPLYFFIGGVIGSVIVIRLLKILENHRVRMRPLCFCGKHSLFIMATHLYICPIIVIPLKRIVIFESAVLGYYVFMIITVVVIFVVDAIVILCWEQIKKIMRNNLSEHNFVLNVAKYI